MMGIVIQAVQVIFLWKFINAIVIVLCNEFLLENIFFNVVNLKKI